MFSPEWAEWATKGFEKLLLYGTDPFLEKTKKNFPYCGKIAKNFSMVWKKTKIFFHSVEKRGTRRGGHPASNGAGYFWRRGAWWNLRIQASWTIMRTWLTDQ